MSYSTGNARLIQQITDPFGRTAQLNRDGNGQLTSVTDVADLSSSFIHDANGWITNLVTTNGTTSFRLVDNGTSPPENSINRAVEITEPNGGTQLFMYREVSSHLTTDTNSPLLLTNLCTELPSGTPSDTWDSTQLSYRNSFHWNPHRYSRLPSLGGFSLCGRL